MLLHSQKGILNARESSNYRSDVCTQQRAHKLQHGIEREKCGMEGGSRGPSQGSELNACSQDSWRSEAST